ncbi:RCC1 domain-containing protein [Amycolatopsis nigrescens]|uniref:RCC1 domain-containing protein n=1 Tax=Amycolatopsis nigrescens TaxID=381445 RepID=UPI0003648990|nr:hypothetical protein [Amycolatopsis nigrescens]
MPNASADRRTPTVTRFALCATVAVLAFGAGGAAAGAGTTQHASPLPSPVFAAPGGAAAVPAPALAPGIGKVVTAGTPFWTQNITNSTVYNRLGIASGVLEVSSSVNQTIARKQDGSLVVWGNDFYHQQTVPPAALGATAVASGYGHLLALKNGEVIAWGSSALGAIEVPPAAKSGVVAISTRGLHSLALKSDGSVVSWGMRTDVPAAASSGVTAISAGGDHNLALKNGGVLAWGSDKFGQTDVPAAAKSGVKAISAGWDHSLALKTDGTVLAWGNNADGQATVPAEAASGVTAISAGSLHSLALLAGGKAVSWGMPAAASNPNPRPETPASGVTAIYAGYRGSVFLK